MPPSLIVFLVAVGVFVLAALAQAVIGFGSAMVAVPLLALVEGPVDAVVGSTMVGVVLTALAWRTERAYVDRPRVLTLNLAGFLGMPVGLLLLAVLRPGELTVMIAVVVLVLVVLLAAGLRLPTNRPARWVAGVSGGLLLTSAGMNGPPLVLANQDLEPRRFRASLQAVFCVQDTVAVLAFLVLGHVSGQAWLLLAAGTLGMPAGWAAGDRLFHRIPAARFRWLVLAGLTATATVGLLHAA